MADEVYSVSRGFVEKVMEPVAQAMRENSKMLQELLAWQEKYPTREDVAATMKGRETSCGVHRGAVEAVHESVKKLSSKFDKAVWIASVCGGMVLGGLFWLWKVSDKLEIILKSAGH